MKKAPPLRCQKAKFTLPNDVHFINCATFSPSSKRVEQAGKKALKAIVNPDWLTASHFFDPVDVLRKSLAKLVNAEHPDRIAMMHAASYGMAALALNLHRAPNLKRGKEILILEGEFPNHPYALEREAAALGLTIISVPMPKGAQMGKIWNQQILERITPNTCLVVAVQTQWILGTLFDLEAIGRQCRAVGALLAIDGTQSVGAIPMDVQKIKPDLLMVAAYKWMMGPYTSGFAYFGAFFDDGIPVEETWMNREKSNEFQGLLERQPNYRPMAQRYNSGEFSNFIQIPMFQAAVEDVLERDPARVQDYCKKLIAPFLPELEALGCQFEDASFRASHLFGIHLPAHAETQAVQQALAKRKVVVAVRSTIIRISPHVYNDAADMSALIEALRAALSTRS
jgi:selenocysteine lyase/cysteine desulfurase